MATNPFDKYVTQPTTEENPFDKYVSKGSVDENPFTKYVQAPTVAPQDITVNEDVIKQKKIAQGQVPVGLETEGGNLLGALNASLPWNRGTPESNATIDKYVGGFAKRYQDTVDSLGGLHIKPENRTWLGDISQNTDINPYVRKVLNPVTSIPANIADYLVSPVFTAGMGLFNAVSGEAASLATLDPMLGVSHEVPNIASKPSVMPEQFRATYENIVKNGTFEDAVNFAEQNGMHFAADDLTKLKSWFEARDAGKNVNYQPTYEHAMSPEASAYGEQLAQFEKEHGVAADNAAGYESNITAHANLVKAQAAEELVNEGKRVVENLTKDWTNAPGINVIHDWSQVDGDIDPAAIGAYMPDGSVAINMTNAAREAELARQNGFAHVTTDDVVQAAVYHESLGHYGLAQKFGADLDKVLSDMYNQSGKRRGFESFKEQVDKWIEENPKAYKNDPNPLARAVEEVLAEKSEKGQLTPTMLQQLLLPIKKYARKLGLKLAYTPEEVEAILASSHRGVTHGVKAEVVAGTDPRYMRTYSGRLNQDKISGIKDLDHWMTEAEDRILAENPNYKDPVTQEETIRKASELGLTTSKLLNESEMRSFQGQQLAAKMFARAQLLTNKLAEVEKAADIVTVKGGSVARANFAKKMAELAAIQAKVSGDTAEIGRALNILKVTRVPAKKSEMVLKYMKETTGNDMWTNPEAMDAVARMMREFKGEATRIASDMTKKSAGDYITMSWYNAMLSGPKTLAINAVNTPLNVGLDLLRERGIPTLYKKLFGIGNASTKDYSSRLKGFWMAMRVFGKDAEGLRMFDPEGTYMRSINAWKTGTVQGRGVALKPMVYQGSNPLKRVGSYIGTYAVRSLAATDEYWRNILQLSSYYGEAARIAEKEGLSGDALGRRMQHLIDNPTDEMMKVTQDYADVMMLKDKPSILGEGIMRLQHPKEDAGGWANVVSVPAKIALPFAKTTDRVTAMGLRNLGPLGLLSRQTKREIAAGGFQREQAITRTVVSTLFLGAMSGYAANGLLTGAADRDHPYSILIDGKWYSYRGIEPFATPVSIVADITNIEKKAQDRGAPIQEKVGDYAWAMGNALKENSSIKDIYDVMSVFDSDPDQAKRAYNNLVVNKLSSVVPAIVRNKAQAEDPYMRDTSSDGTVQGRLEDRIKASLPGYSKELPIRHDKWGREVRRDGKDFIEKDPTVLEVEALQKKVKQPIIGDLQKTVNINGFKTRLNSEEFQKYQRLAGYWTLQYVKQDMETEEYKKGSKEEKIQIIQKARNEARKDARDYLFKGNE